MRNKTVLEKKLICRRNPLRLDWRSRWMVAARRLLVRIGDAALEACGASTFSLAELRIATRNSQCWRKAVDGATRRIASPTLTALAGERGQ
jgi:hypothetical protein